MRYERDKDLAWIITFTSFLIFLLSAIACSFFNSIPAKAPTPIILARSSLNTAFLDVLSGFIKMVSMGFIAFGIYGVIFWPRGRNS